MSVVAAKFRRRFRVPFPMFINILVPQCKEKNIFELKGRGHFTIPIEFKLLIALRILGRDAVADECEELSFVSESTCHYIFKKFVTNYSKHFYDQYVKCPVGNDLLKVMEVYRRLGFPGCVGSIDCTHVKWSMCSKDEKWKASGKEGYPTLSFEAVVTHDRLCIHLSIAFLGSYNDITISKNDIFIQWLLSGLLSNVA